MCTAKALKLEGTIFYSFFFQQVKKLKMDTVPDGNVAALVCMSYIITPLSS